MQTFEPPTKQAQKLENGRDLLCMIQRPNNIFGLLAGWFVRLADQLQISSCLQKHVKWHFSFVGLRLFCSFYYFILHSPF
jgi:hypothetical protein